MPFQKGNRHSVGKGRKPGALNKMTEESALYKIGRFAPLERLREMWDKLNPEQQAKIIMELMDFFHPKYTKAKAPKERSTNDNMLNIKALMELASEKEDVE